MRRRTFLVVCGMASTSLVAGCSGDGTVQAESPSATEQTRGGSPTGTERATPTPTPEHLTVGSTSFGVLVEKETGPDKWESVDRSTFSKQQDDDIVFMMLDVGPLSADPNGEYEIENRWEIYQGNESVFSHATGAVSTGLSDDTIASVEFFIPIADLNAGEYTIEARFIDHLEDATRTREATFTIAE